MTLDTDAAKIAHKFNIPADVAQRMANCLYQWLNDGSTTELHAAEFLDETFADQGYADLPWNDIVECFISEQPCPPHNV